MPAEGPEDADYVAEDDDFGAAELGMGEWDDEGFEQVDGLSVPWAALPPAPPPPARAPLEQLALPGAFSDDALAAPSDGMLLFPGKTPPAPAPQYLWTLVGPSAALRDQVACDADQQSNRYLLRSGAPPALKWEEARAGCVPLGTTVLGVIEEVRPYGSFIGFVANGMAKGTLGEDSRIRGFCKAEELGPLVGFGEKAVGLQVGVRILSVDPQTQRIYVSAKQADPVWYDPKRVVESHAAQTIPRRPSDAVAEDLFGLLGN